MLKLLLKLLVLPPELLQMHAQGYADMASQAWAEHLCTLKNRWALLALSAVCTVLALVWAGVALLLWSALPQVDARWAWVLPLPPPLRWPSRLRLAPAPPVARSAWP